MNPSRDELTAMMAEHPLTLTPGIANLIKALHLREQHVYFVSGGFRRFMFSKKTPPHLSPIQLTSGRKFTFNFTFIFVRALKFTLKFAFDNIVKFM